MNVFFAIAAFKHFFQLCELVKLEMMFSEFGLLLMREMLFMLPSLRFSGVSGTIVSSMLRKKERSRFFLLKALRLRVSSLFHQT